MKAKKQTRKKRCFACGQVIAMHSVAAKARWSGVSPEARSEQMRAVRAAREEKKK